MNMIYLSDGVVISYNKTGHITEWHKCSCCETMTSLADLLETKLDRRAGFCSEHCKTVYEEINWHLEEAVSL